MAAVVVAMVKFLYSNQANNEAYYETKKRAVCYRFLNGVAVIPHYQSFYANRGGCHGPVSYTCT